MGALREHGMNPAALALTIMERDGYACRHCGKRGRPGLDSDSLQVHHRVPRRQGGSNDPENLETVCGACHRQADKDYWLAALRDGSARAKARRQQLPFTAADAEALGEILLQPSQAASYLEVSDLRIRQLLRSGKLPGQKVGGTWIIVGRDLAAVVDRPVGWRKGRPRKVKPEQG